MNKTEKIGLVVIIVGLLLKFSHIPGATILLILGSTFLYFYYLLFSFAIFNSVEIRNIFKKSSYENTTPKRIIFSVCSGFVLSAGIYGSMFAIQFYPGALTQLSSCIAIGIILVAISFLMKTESNSVYLKTIRKRLFLVLAFAIIFYVIPTRNLAHAVYWHNTEYADALVDTIEDPENIELRRKLQKLQDKY